VINVMASVSVDSNACNHSDAISAGQGQKVSDAIHVSDFSLAKSNIFCNISDVMNVMASVSLVMLVKLAMLSAQVKVRIGTVISPYSSRWNGVRIM